jgi:hypothetical protein
MLGVLVEINGHTVEFFDYREICQGGPKACNLLIDQRLIEGRFDPSPLSIAGKLLIPKRKISFFKSGYVLTAIDLNTGETQALSKIIPYMKLLKIDDGYIQFATTVWGSETGRLPLI